MCKLEIYNAKKDQIHHNENNKKGKFLTEIDYIIFFESVDSNEYDQIIIDKDDIH